MNVTNIESIDLNLLTVFDAVMKSRNTTRAASRLGLTQPAVSHALKRLRILLDDPLFVRTPRGMMPTPIAQEIAVDIHAALKQVEAILNREKGFSPKTSTRRFILGLSDYASFVILPDLLDRLTTAAPGVAVTVKNTNHSSGLEMLEDDAAELIIGNFPSMPPHLRRMMLFRDGFLVAGRNRHPGLTGKLTRKKYLRMEHLQISTRGEPYGYIDAVLDKKGARAVKVTVPHFLSAPFLLQRTNLIATEPSRLLKPLQKSLGFTLIEPPFSIPHFDVTMNWHLRYDEDAGHIWLREHIGSIFSGNRHRQ